MTRRLLARLKGSRSIGLAVVLAITPLLVESMVSAASNGTSCANLAALTIPGITIKSSTAIAAGPFTPPAPNAAITLPASCRGEATARPAGDADLQFGG